MKCLHDLQLIVMPMLLSFPFFPIPTCPLKWNLLDKFQVLVRWVNLQSKGKCSKVMHTISDPAGKQLQAAEERRQGQLHKACQLRGGSGVDTNLLQHIFTFFEVAIQCQQKLRDCLLLQTPTALLYNSLICVYMCTWEEEKLIITAWFWHKVVTWSKGGYSGGTLTRCSITVLRPVTTSTIVRLVAEWNSYSSRF